MGQTKLYQKLGYTLASFKKKLEEEYQRNGKSQAQIAKELGCNSETLRTWFIRLGIKARTPSERLEKRWHNEVSLNSKQLSILDGLLLSDLHLQKPHIQARASFGFKHKEICDSIRKELLPLDFSEPWESPSTGCFHSKSKSSDILTDIHSKWYNEGVKIVPRDIQITPETLYWWYLGDGRVQDYGLGLCTDSFSIEDVVFLKESLAILGVECSLIKANNRLRIRSSSVRDFISLIGPCRHSCYSYKWEVRIKRRNNRWTEE